MDLRAGDLKEILQCKQRLNEFKEDANKCLNLIKVGIQS